MKKLLLVTVLMFNGLVWSLHSSAGPFIVDHTCVALYTNLTSADIARVKTMWADIVGASHSLGYRVGCQLLQSNVDSRLQVSVTDSGPMEGPTTNHLRISRAYWNTTYGSWGYGGNDGNEQTWYTSPPDIERTKAHLTYANIQGFGLSVFGFGWSWQPSWHNLATSAIDPVYQVQWSGSSVGGPDGDLAWALDAQSLASTSNHICMDTYLQATEQYREHCRSNRYATTVVFSTAPVDYTGDTAYQVFLKNNHIRSYVSNTTDAVLFDYADILCWDDAGNRTTNAWSDLGGNPKFYEWVAVDNYKNLDGSLSGTGYHIGERGALRLGKALWYMLARIAERSLLPPAPLLQASCTIPGVIQLQFAASSNAIYTVEFNSDLASPSWQILTNISSQPYERTIQYRDQPSSTNASGFYRVAVQPAP